MTGKFSKLAERTTARTTAPTASSVLVRRDVGTAGLPLTLRFDGDVDVPVWVAQHGADLRTELHRHGALLFRSPTPADFQAVVAAFSGAQVDYVGGAAVRSRVSADTYTASEYPAELAIRQHSEFCYSHDWPMLLFFYCETAAPVGGQTPLVDNRLLHREMPARIRAEVEDRGLIYMRGYGYNRTWQRSYETESRREVEEICAREGRRVEWLDGDRLRTYERRPGVARHPVTDEPVWFNYAHGFHISRMDDAIRDALAGSPDDTDADLWPNNVLWGDGAEIDPGVITEIHDVVAANTTQFDWREGDVLVVDNMLTGHGRQPYSGPRRILLKMAEAYAAVVASRATAGTAVDRVR